MVLDATKLVADAQRRHKTAPTSTAALGRALMGALLMASFGKEDESVQARQIACLICVHEHAHISDQAELCSAQSQGVVGWELA